MPQFTWKTRPRLAKLKKFSAPLTNLLVTHLSFLPSNSTSSFSPFVFFALGYVLNVILSHFVFACSIFRLKCWKESLLPLIHRVISSTSILQSSCLWLDFFHNPSKSYFLSLFHPFHAELFFLD